MSDTAQSYDSYMDTLLIVMETIHPVRVFEWGSGRSTQVMSMYPTVQKMVTVEHDKEWYEKARCNRLSNLNLIIQPDLDLYVTEIAGEPKQDLIFVDGKSRNECLDIARDYLNDDGVVMLHDAKRSEYESAIKRYPYQIWTDDGHTVTLAIKHKIYDRLYPILNHLTNTIGVKS